MTETCAPAPLKAAPLVSDWIRFGAGRRTEVLTGRVELGQGNLTALLQMAADELCLDPSEVAILPADTARTPNEGYTAGSMSVSQGGMALRWAAAAARVLILREAARRLNSGAGELTVSKGAILRDGAPTGLDIRDVGCESDLDLPAVDHAELLSRNLRSPSGARLARIDLAERILGAPFVHDLRPAGLLHGRAIRPPAVGSTLEAVDIDGLRARPGVVECMRNASFFGVIADASWNAVRAAEWARRTARWSRVDGPPDAPLDVIRAADGPSETVFQSGDGEHAGGQAISVTVTRPYLSHASIGPAAALAVWQDGKLDVKSHSQGVFQLRAALAVMFDVAADMIRVAHAPGAGCYGHNGADDAALDAALLASAVPGRPVLVVWSRADEFRAAPLGPAMATTARAQVDGDGRIRSMEVRVNSAPHANRPGANGAVNLVAGTEVVDAIPFPVSKDLGLERGGGADRNAVPGYAIPSCSVAKRLVHDLPYRTSSLRALGATVNVFAIETLMDRIAIETGQDPVALRLAHLDDPRARAVIEAVMADTAAGLRTASEASGWGLAFARYKNIAAYAAIVARVKVDAEVRVTHVAAAVDVGEVISPDGAVNQIEGGIIQAISWALKEEIRFDGAAVATETWFDYPILTFSEVPEVSVRLMDRPDDPPLGCAEAVQGPVVAAVAAAIRNAVGVQITDMPFTRDRIVSTLI